MSREHPVIAVDGSAVNCSGRPDYVWVAICGRIYEAINPAGSASH
ncbi:MAG TPA: hypothetical protein VKV31_01775 [bacterium]|nr:hypothetical protein [bacterium]